MKNKFADSRVISYVPWMIVLCSVLFIVTSFVFYFQRINIYGGQKIYLTQDSVSVVDKTESYGISVFGRKKAFTIDEGFYDIPEDWYFNRIVIDFGSINKNKPVAVRIVNKKDEVLLDTILLNSQTLPISQLKYDQRLSKKERFIGCEKSALIKTVLTIFLIWLSVAQCLSTCFLILYCIIKRQTANKKLKLIFGLIGLGFLTLFLFQYLVIGKLFLWTGFFLQTSLFIIFILMINKFVKNQTKFKQNFITILSSIFVGIIIVEAFMRVAGINVTAFEKRFGYYESIQYQFRIQELHIRNAYESYILENEEFKFERQSNSLGLSGEEPVLQKSENEFRIIAIGDSFTEGDGAHKDSTWLKFLERKMLDTDSLNYSFINAGVCGSDPIYEFRLLKDKLLVYKPDLVIVSYGFDLTDVITRGGKERYQTQKPAIERRWWQPLYSVSFFTRLIVHNLCGYNDLLMTKSDFELAKQKAISDLKISIDDFKKLSELEGFELLIVFFPIQNELDSGKYSSNMELIEYSNKLGISTLDMMKYYRQEQNINEKNSATYYWKKDGHHNSAGYEKYAEGVLWKLKN